MDTASSDFGAVADAIDAVLPQTQCTRCGYTDCRRYAEAIARDGVAINRCPPGGAEGVARLSAVTGRPVLPLDSTCGTESPRSRAVVDESWCIGCTLCIAACPVDCIVGAPKRMHVVVADDCTGCELCLPVCPVDCISLVDASSPLTGWSAWSDDDAVKARDRYRVHLERTARHDEEQAARRSTKAQAKLANLAQHSRIEDPLALDRKRAVIEAALARARSKAVPPTTPR